MASGPCRPATGRVAPRFGTSVVETIFDQVIKEEIELRRGNAGGWGSQAVDLSPARDPGWPGQRRRTSGIVGSSPRHSESSSVDRRP
jgi:hypothetical protein